MHVTPLPHMAAILEHVHFGTELDDEARAQRDRWAEMPKAHAPWVVASRRSRLRDLLLDPAGQRITTRKLGELLGRPWAEYVETWQPSRLTVAEFVVRELARSGTAVRLGDAVTAARKTAELTQLELAHRCGISQPYISQLERGTRLRPVPAGVLRLIADATGCPELAEAGR